MKRFRDALRSRDESGKLADIALRDEIAAFDLISSLGSADPGVRETASKAILEVARKDSDKLTNIVLRWSGERHYKLNAFLKWTDGLESKNLGKVRKVLEDRVKTATVVDQLINEYDSVNEKNDKLRDLYAQKKVTQQAFETIRKEYDAELSQATKKLLVQFLINCHQLEDLSKTRAKIKDDLSVLETKATLGDIGRKESESLKAESNRLLAEIQEKDKKLTEELSVMLMSSGPVKVYDENGKIVAVASEFVVNRDGHAVELKVRFLSEGDLQAVQMMDNRSALVTLIYNTSSRGPQDAVLTADRLTPDIVDKVSMLVASELKISPEEALHIDKLRHYLELSSWKSAKAKTASVPTLALDPSEKGFAIRAGTIKVEQLKSAEGKIAEPGKIAVGRLEEEAPPLKPVAAEQKPPPEERELTLESVPAEAPAAPGDKELEEEVENLKAMLDEDEATKSTKKERDIEVLDDKVLDEIDKAAEKLRQRMKSR